MQTLYKKTLHLLKERPRSKTLKDIAEEVNFSEPWLRAFSMGKIHDPSVNKIQKLYEHLNNSKLKV